MNLAGDDDDDDDGDAVFPRTLASGFVSSRSWFNVIARRMWISASFRQDQAGCFTSSGDGVVARVSRISVSILLLFYYFLIDILVFDERVLVEFYNEHGELCYYAYTFYFILFYLLPEKNFFLLFILKIADIESYFFIFDKQTVVPFVYPSFQRRSFDREE